MAKAGWTPQLNNRPRKSSKNFFWGIGLCSCQEEPAPKAPREPRCLANLMSGTAYLA